MARYVTAVETLTFEDEPGEAPSKPLTWEGMVKALFADPRLQQVLDVFTLQDLRRKLIKLVYIEGDFSDKTTAAISDDEYSAIVPILKRPQTFTSRFIHSEGGETFFRAFIDAPTKDPVAAAVAAKKAREAADAAAAALPKPAEPEAG